MFAKAYLHISTLSRNELESLRQIYSSQRSMTVDLEVSLIYFVLLGG